MWTVFVLSFFFFFIFKFELFIATLAIVHAFSLICLFASQDGGSNFQNSLSNSGPQQQHFPRGGASMADVSAADATFHASAGGMPGMQPGGPGSNPSQVMSQAPMDYGGINGRPHLPSGVNGIVQHAAAAEALVTVSLLFVGTSMMICKK